MSDHTVTQEIESWIAQHGSERDALNIAISKLHVAHSLMQEQELTELRSLNAKLLEALEDLVKRDYYSGQPEHFQRTEKARAAIAKARCESKTLVTSEGKSE